MKIKRLAAALAIVCAAGFPEAATAQTPPSPLSEVYACAEIASDAERLACYDAAAGRLRAAETSGALVAVDRAQVESIERDAFGFSLPNLSRLFGQRGGDDDLTAPVTAPAPVAIAPDSDARDAADRAIQPVNAVTMHIASVEQRARGRSAFTMTNGQVWVQVEGVSARHARVGGEVTIRRAAMGSYLMSIESGGPALRVRREE